MIRVTEGQSSRHLVGSVPGSAAQGDNTPLHWASMRGHVEVVKLLLERGADRAIRNKQARLCPDQKASRGSIGCWMLVPTPQETDGIVACIESEGMMQADALKDAQVVMWWFMWCLLQSSLQCGIIQKCVSLCPASHLTPSAGSCCDASHTHCH